jgi:hypothetical protein
VPRAAGLRVERLAQQERVAWVVDVDEADGHRERVVRLLAKAQALLISIEVSSFERAPTLGPPDLKQAIGRAVTREEGAVAHQHRISLGGPQRRRGGGIGELPRLFLGATQRKAAQTGDDEALL